VNKQATLRLLISLLPMKTLNAIGPSNLPDQTVLGSRVRGRSSAASLFDLLVVVV